MTRTEELATRWSAVMMANYRTPPVALERGAGATVWDVDGREYTDLLGGIATTILGHAHPKVVEAISTQAAKLGHVSNLAMHEPGLLLAERLLELAGRPGPRLLLQLRRRGERGGVQDQPADRPPRGGHRGGLLPRPHHGRPGADRPARQGRRLRAAARRRPVRAVRRRGRARRRRRRPDGDGAARADARRGRRAAPARGLPRRRRVDGGVPPARCSPSTRCRPAWAAPARGSRTRPTDCSPTSSRWPRRSAAGCRWAPCWPSATAADLMTAGSHGSTFGGNPIAAAAALAVSTPSATRGCSSGPRSSSTASRARHRGARAPRGQRRPGQRRAARRRPHRRRPRPRWRRRCGRPAS